MMMMSPHESQKPMQKTSLDDDLPAFSSFCLKIERLSCQEKNSLSSSMFKRRMIMQSQEEGRWDRDCILVSQDKNAFVMSLSRTQRTTSLQSQTMRQHLHE